MSSSREESAHTYINLLVSFLGVVQLNMFHVNQLLQGRCILSFTECVCMCARGGVCVCVFADSLSLINFMFNSLIFSKYSLPHKKLEHFFLLCNVLQVFLGAPYLKAYSLYYKSYLELPIPVWDWKSNLHCTILLRCLSNFFTSG